MFGKNLAGLFFVGAWLCCMGGTLQIESKESVLQWIDIQNVTLTDLEPAGSEESWLNPKLYVARNKHGGGVIPGKYVDKLGIFYYADGGTWHDSISCEVLVYPRGSVSWISVDVLKSLENVIIGGIDPRTNEILRICRLEILVGTNIKEKHLMPGKLTSSGECIGVWNGVVTEKRNYEVLVMNSYGKFKSHEDLYRHQYEKKGLTFVVNIYHFDAKSIRREGAEDRIAMKNILNELGYIIFYGNRDDRRGTWYNEDVLKATREFKEACQIQIPDSVIAYYVKDGFHEKIAISDMKIVRWNDLNTKIDKITYARVDINKNIAHDIYNRNCPELQGKPKLFLVSACQDFEMDFESYGDNCGGSERYVREKLKRRDW